MIDVDNLLFTTITELNEYIDNLDRDKISPFVNTPNNKELASLLLLLEVKYDSPYIIHYKYMTYLIKYYIPIVLKKSNESIIL